MNPCLSDRYDARQDGGGVAQSFEFVMRIFGVHRYGPMPGELLTDFLGDSAIR